VLATYTVGKEPPQRWLANTLLIPSLLWHHDSLPGFLRSHGRASLHRPNGKAQQQRNGSVFGA
jgi:hypothetical protein